MQRRTTVVTALSVAGVLVTGAAALGANIRILGAADPGGLGQLSASAPAVAPADTAGNLALVREVGARAAQSFAVQDAGTVDLETPPAAGLRLGAVVPNDGWQWTADQATSDAVTVTFTSASTAYRFTATLAPDGSISAAVDQPATGTYPATATAPAAARSHDEGHGHEGGGDDD